MAAERGSLQLSIIDSLLSNSRAAGRPGKRVLYLKRGI
jgi:hypothetical protein